MEDFLAKIVVFLQKPFKEAVGFYSQMISYPLIMFFRSIFSRTFCSKIFVFLRIYVPGPPEKKSRILFKKKNDNLFLTS